MYIYIIYTLSMLRSLHSLTCDPAGRLVLYGGLGKITFLSTFFFLIDRFWNFYGFSFIIFRLKCFDFLNVQQAVSKNKK